MFLFKSSRATYRKVLHGERHAFRYGPTDVKGDELVFLSENRERTGTLHKQIQAIAKLKDVRPAVGGELDAAFPGQRALERWKYVVELYFPRMLERPFNLHAVPGFNAKRYATVQGFAKLDETDSTAIFAYLCDTHRELILELSNLQNPERDAS